MYSLTGAWRRMPFDSALQWFQYQARVSGSLSSAFPQIKEKEQSKSFGIICIPEVNHAQSVHSVGCTYKVKERETTFLTVGEMVSSLKMKGKYLRKYHHPTFQTSGHK